MACPRCRRGFSIVELLITLSIFAILTAALLVKYPQFSQQLSLRRTAQEIALTIRQAQAYAMAAKEFQGKFPGYGIHFKIASSSSFILFADVNENNLYDGESEKIETFKIQTSAYISGLCGNLKTSPPGTCGLSKLDINFYRSTANLKSGSSIFSDAEVLISSSRGKTETKIILIWISGQIAVE